MQESGEVRILRGFLKGVHLSRITGSQIHPVRNATKSRACCGNDAPRAEKRDTDCKVLALPSELGNPHRTRVPTFPQQRLRRRTNLPKLQNPPKSQGLTDSCAEPEKVNRNPRHRHSGSRTGSNPAAKSDQNRGRLGERVMKAAIVAVCLGNTRLRVTFTSLLSLPARD